MHAGWQHSTAYGELFWAAGVCEVAGGEGGRHPGQGQGECVSVYVCGVVQDVSVCEVRRGGVWYRVHVKG